EKSSAWHTASSKSWLPVIASRRDACFAPSRHACAPHMKTKPRVLLLSASSGAGHVRAAQALEKAFTARGDCVVEHIDTIRYVSKLFQRIYEKAYISMVRRVPEL